MSSLAPAPWRVTQSAAPSTTSAGVGSWGALEPARRPTQFVVFAGSIAAGAYAGYKLAGGGISGVAAGAYGAVAAPIAVFVLLIITRVDL